MSTIQTLILNAFADRLSHLSIANGYTITPKKIYRVSLGAFQNQDLPVINVFLSGDTREAENYGVEQRRVFIEVQYLENSRLKDGDSFIDPAFEAGYSIATILFRNPSAPKNSDPVEMDLNGLVESLKITTITPFSGDSTSSWSGVSVVFEAVYSRPVGKYL